MTKNHILQDRITSDKWSITIDNEELQYSLTTSPSQFEPVFEDRINANNHYRLFISDGEMAIESTSVIQSSIIELEDASANKVWKLIVTDGEFAYTEVTPISVTSYGVNIIQSLYYFLNHTNYISTGSGFYTNQTLKGKYNSEIILGPPHSLNKISPLTLSIAQDPLLPENDTFASKYMEQTFPFHIDGYVSGAQVEEKNQFIRDQIREDIRYLFTDTDYMDLYMVDSEGKINTLNIISNCEITNVRDENLPVTGPLAVERNKFRVSFDIVLVRNA